MRKEEKKIAMRLTVLAIIVGVLCGMMFMSPAGTEMEAQAYENMEE